MSKHSIKYQTLFGYLTKAEQMNPEGARKHIDLIRRFSPKLLRALEQWLNDITPDVAVGDVTFVELTTDEGMSPIRAFMMLDWMERDPERAMHFMAEQRFATIMPPLSDTMRDKLRQVALTLKAKGVTIDEPQPAQRVEHDLPDETDIVIPNPQSAPQVTNTEQHEQP